MKNKIYLNDLDFICNNKLIPWEKLEGTTVLVTGATGLIGSLLVNSLLNKGNIKVIAQVRSEEKAKEKFINENNSNLILLVQNINKPYNIDVSIDYIIHAASETASKMFVEQPVETIKTAVNGTINTLELAKEKKATSYVYLSSMEVYGTHTTDEAINEEHPSIINSTEVRNSYPTAKLLCENLCVSYKKEYNVNAKICRLVQTFGPGIDKNDNRVFAEFLRCAMENKNIVLKTKGESKRCYLYTADAVIGILIVLLNGEEDIYNIANEKTFCSIKEIAEIVCSRIANNKIKVEFNIDEKNERGFMNYHSYLLETKKLKFLGFEPSKDLEEMMRNTIEFFN